MLFHIRLQTKRTKEFGIVGKYGLGNCPPFHITPDNIKIYRNDTSNFPYSAYHYYCAPGNAQHLELLVLVILIIVILKHKRLFSNCLILYGVNMAIQLKKVMVGLEMQGHGNLMLVG